MRSWAWSAFFLLPACGELSIEQAEQSIAVEHGPPVISLDAPIAHQAPSLASEHLPVIARGPTLDLIVWVEAGPPGAATTIRGVRRTSRGILADPEPLIFGTGSNARPAVVFGGDRFLVAWEDHGRTRAATLEKSGAVTMLPPIVIGDRPIHSPAVAWNGHTFLIAGVTERPGDLRATRLSPTGKVIDRNGLILALRPESAPELATDGASFFVVYKAGAIVGQRISANARILDPEPIVIGSEATFDAAPSVAWIGGSYLVAWSGGAIAAQRVSSEGTLVGERLLLPGVGHPAIAFDGRLALVVWRDREAIVGARISPYGIVFDRPVLTISERPLAAESVRVAARTSGFTAVAVARSPATGLDVFAVDVALDGSVAEPDGQILALGKSFAFEPYAAPSPYGALALWSAQHRPDAIGADIYAANVDSVREAPLPVSSILSDRRLDERVPAAAWGNGAYLAVWTEDQTTVWAMRLTPYGKPIDPEPIAVARGTDVRAIDVAYDGEMWLVAWAEHIFGGTRVLAARVLDSGAVADDEPLVIAHPATRSFAEALPVAVHVAAGQRRFLVAWETETLFAGGPRVSVARIENDLRAPRIDPLFSRAGSASAFASNGSSFVLAFSDEHGVNAMFFDPRGGTRDGEPILVSDARASATALAEHGFYVLAWVENGMLTSVGLAPNGGAVSTEVTFPIGDGASIALAADRSHTVLLTGGGAMPSAILARVFR